MKTQQKFTVFHRTLHWIMAIAIPVLFMTGFLRMHWMNKNHIVEIIAKKNSVIPKEQITEIAITIREPMWQWHELFAYVIVFAFFTRVIYILAKGIRFPNPFKGNQPIKERLQGFTYLYFYLFVFISAVTGVCIKQGFFPQWREGIETVHKWGLYWFPIFIILHISGIVIAEFSNKKGIASKMISGD